MSESVSECVSECVSAGVTVMVCYSIKIVIAALLLVTCTHVTLDTIGCGSGSYTSIS